MLECNRVGRTVTESAGLNGITMYNLIYRETDPRLQNGYYYMFNWVANPLVNPSFLSRLNIAVRYFGEILR